MLSQNVGMESENTVIDEMYAAFPKLLADEKRLADLHAAIEAGDVSLAGQYSSLEDSFTRAGGYEFRGRCRGMLINLGFEERFHTLKISSLSGGQKTRVALARMLLSSPDVMILDEPTNHLDVKSLFWLENYLKASPLTIIVVSHDRYFLDVVTNKTLDIENRRARLYLGNYTTYKQKKETDREVQMRHYVNQQREIERIEKIIEQQHRWNRERNIRTAESKQKQIDRMEKIDKPDALPDTVRMRFVSSGEIVGSVMSFRGLTKGYPGKPLFRDFSAEIKKNERVFITGDNGCGKSTLIKIIAGIERADKGFIEPGYNVTIGYYDQENQNLDPSNTVLDELWNCEPNLSETEVRNALALFLFRSDDVAKSVSVLSGGERARLTLAKLLLKKMNLLVLDEPTNHLDIGSREALENAVAEFDGTVIAVSHDRYFISRLATRILDFNAVNQGEIYDYHGGYADYIEFRDKVLSPREEKAAPAVTDAKQAYLDNKRSVAEKRKHENALRRTKEQISALESRLAEIDVLMKGEADTNAELLSELYEKKETAEAELLGLYEKLEALGGEI
nr:ABC-F family ATP-binding cassette domain-containing protein [Clostridiales bacterium]